MRWIISDIVEKVFISFFYYLSYRVQVLPTAATQKTFKALPVRCSGETPPGARLDITDMMSDFEDLKATKRLSIKIKIVILI